MSLLTLSKAPLLFCCFFLLNSLLFSCEEGSENRDTPTPVEEPTSNPAPAVQPRQTLEGFEFDACKIMDLGCSCAYQLLEDKDKDKAPFFFISDMEENACIQINGGMQSLTSQDGVYQNEHYQVVVDTKQLTQYEGEANVYEGDLLLKDKEGNILHTQPVSGTCGC